MFGGPKCKELFAAVERKDEDAICEIISSKQASPNSYFSPHYTKSDSGRHSILYECVRFDMIRAVRLLCALGADVKSSFCFTCGFTVCEQAVMLKRAKIFTELLMLDDIFENNILESAHETAIGLLNYIIAVDGSSEMLRIFLKSKYGTSDILSYTYNNGNFPLYQAVMRDNVDMCYLLFQFGARINSLEDRSRALKQAVFRNNPKMIIFLVNVVGIPINTSVFQFAVSHGLYSAVNVLVNLGVCVNCINEFGKMPFYYAAMNIDLRMMKLLFYSGADISLRAYRANPERIYGYYRDHSKIIEFIDFQLNSCSPLDAQDPDELINEDIR